MKGGAIMAHSAEKIAETIICLARDRQIDLTNLKLQKLLYYSQAWHLVFEDRVLFDDAIEAWIHGPVVPSVFKRYRDYRWTVIDCDVTPVQDVMAIRHIKSVLDSYGSFGATQLERLTHRETPWIMARRGIPRDEPSHNVITTDSMKDYYRQSIHG
jgi:uncharacterized phage-associated protein